MVENVNQDLLSNRMEGLLGVWELLSKRFPEDYKGCHLHPILQREAVENYLNDRAIYMLRHRIEPPSKIMLHKIAGMMAASICKFKPIQLSPNQADWSKDTYQNERFALWHGLAICAEPYVNLTGEVFKVMLEGDLFYELEKSILSLFQRRPDSADSFIVIFQLLCSHFFRLALEPPPDVY